MKKFLQKWLEVKDVNVTIPTDIIKKHVVEAIEEAMLPEVKFQTSILHYPWNSRNVRGTIEKTVRRIVAMDAADAGRDEAKRLVNNELSEINSEEFIDKVVDRILKKQVR